MTSYRLSIQDKTHTIITPNLRGITATYLTIELDGGKGRDISFGELGLNPDKEYAFYATSGMDYPLLRQVIAIRVGNFLHVAAYYDTKPYTEPRAGSPFVGGTVKIGETGFKIGDFAFGEQFFEETFPVNILCFEIIPDGRVRVKIGQPGLKIGDFQVGQEILPETT